MPSTLFLFIKIPWSRNLKAWVSSCLEKSFSPFFRLFFGSPRYQTFFCVIGFLLLQGLSDISFNPIERNFCSFLGSLLRSPCLKPKLVFVAFFMRISLAQELTGVNFKKINQPFWALFFGLVSEIMCFRTLTCPWHRDLRLQAVNFIGHIRFPI